jgi:hypothetical protein
MNPQLSATGFKGIRNLPYDCGINGIRNYPQSWAAESSTIFVIRSEHSNP